MKVRGVLNYLFRLIFLLVLPIGVVFYSGWNFGRFYERKAIRERLEEIDSIHRQDSIRQYIDISIMACDCIKKVNSLLQKRLNDSAEVNTAIMMDDGTLRVAINGLYHKKNAKGEYQKKWSEVNIQADYCPFCGKPYKEKTEKDSND